MRVHDRDCGVRYNRLCVKMVASSLLNLCIKVRTNMHLKFKMLLSKCCDYILTFGNLCVVVIMGITKEYLVEV